MGFGFGREVISPENFTVFVERVERKPSEPKTNTSIKKKHLCNNAANANFVSYNSLSPIESKKIEKMPISSLKPSKTEKSWNSEYGKGWKDGKGRKEFGGSNVVKESQLGSQKNVSPNVKRRVTFELHSCKGTSVKSSSKSSGVSGNSVHTLPSTAPSSRKRVKHVRSVSCSDETPNSVARKRGMGSNVRTSPETGSSKSFSPEHKKICFSEKFRDSHNGSPQTKSKSIFPLGNIYRGPKNLVFEREPLHKKDTQTNDTVARVRSVGQEGGVSKPIPSNNLVLGFGKGNYGHGSIMKGVKNVNIFTKHSCSNIGGINREEKPNSRIPSSPSLESVEQLKNAGNEEFKRGCFLEAISFYNKAIALRPGNAACHNNKAAALAGLGWYMEAVRECLKAINCDPLYSHAHYRLGTLYARLGHMEDAKKHFKLSGEELGCKATQNLHHLESRLMNIRKARKIGDWGRILTESTLAIEAGADASDQVVAVKAEALLKLHRAEEALELLIAARKLEEYKWPKARIGNSCLPIIETQVCMYLGRFDDAVLAAERAVNLNEGTETLMWLRKARAVADARRTGNDFFKSSNYIEACIAYTRGLDFSPTNSVLLCNRAACRTKLGQWEMAVDDCTAALRNRPDYTKALLRRAHSNAQLERWEESMRDYTLLSREMPGDVGIVNSLLQVQTEIKKAQQGRSYKVQAGGYVAPLHCYHPFMSTVESASENVGKSRTDICNN